MKLFVTQSTGGNITINAEWQDTPQGKQGAIVSFHNVCKNLWNDANTDTALVEITDENLNTWNGYREDINKLSQYPEYNEEFEYGKGAVVTYENEDYEYINDEPSTGNLPTDTDYWQEYVPNGKLYVMSVSNDNLATKDTTEWTPDREGIKGAMVNYHTRCATYWNAPDVITGTVKILNERLDSSKSEYIFHSEE